MISEYLTIFHARCNAKILIFTLSRTHLSGNTLKHTVHPGCNIHAHKDNNNTWNHAKLDPITQPSKSKLTWDNLIHLTPS